MELARRLDGMFAFAVWDERRRRLVLGRDRVGKKPLYYWSSGGRLVFGSEIKAVLADPAVPRRLDQGAIPAYLTFGYVPTPRTFFDGHPEPPARPRADLRAGRRARASSATGSRRWSASDGDGQLDVSLHDAAARGARAASRGGPPAADLRRAARRVPERRHRLERGRRPDGRADRPARSRRSRSASRTATASTSARTHAWSRERHRTDHHEFVVHPDAVDLVERLVWHHDQPFGDSSAIPTFLLSEVTRRHVTVALSGDGGDELFAGYERFAAGLAARRYAALPGAAAARRRRRDRACCPTGRCAGAAGSAAALRAASPSAGLPDAYRSWISYVAGRRSRRAARRPRATTGRLEDYRAIWSELGGGAPARPAARPQPADLPARRPAREDGPDEHGPRARGALAVPRHRAARVRRRACRRALKARGLSLKRVLKAAVQDLLPTEILSGRRRASACRSTAGSARTCASYVDSTLGRPDAA